MSIKSDWTQDHSTKLQILLDAKVSITRIAEVLGFSPAMIRTRRKELEPKESPAPMPVRDPIEDMRDSLTPIAFAEKILALHGKIETLREQHYINGKPATPAMKIEEANRLLVALGHKPITLRR